jgi:general nucleoside transport system ATP-binding protein
VITLTGISKRFTGVTALEGVSLSFASGQVHGLLGENGAGKSTLMNILFGMLQPDAGTIAVDGVVTRIRSPRAACRFGIGMVHQHFKLVPTLSVMDNLVLALATSYGRVDRAAWRARILQRAAALHWVVDVDARVETLGVGQQQRVEILKALLAIEASGAKSRTLILDEPTAVLAPQEIDELLSAVRVLAADGVAVVYISHKLAEIASVCSEVSVLRRGRLMHQGPASESPERLAELMIGSVVARSARTAQPAPQESSARITVDGVTGLLTDERSSITYRWWCAQGKSSVSLGLKEMVRYHWCRRFLASWYLTKVVSRFPFSGITSASFQKIVNEKP